MIQRLHALDPLGLDTDGDRYCHAIGFREVHPTDIVLCVECRNVLTATPHPAREGVFLVTECRGVPLCERDGCLAAHAVRHQRAADEARWAEEAAARAARREERRSA